MVGSLVLVSLAAASRWGAPQPLCTIADRRINESSGLTSSLRTPGVWYTHNDSGDRPRFFRFDEKGKVTGVFTIPGAAAQDWEEMSAQTLEGRQWLYLGDVGDNPRQRKEIVIYRVEEPRGDSQGITDFTSYRIRYEDRARDCEAFFVTKNGDIWLISKAREGETVVYLVSAPKSASVNVAKVVGRLPIDTGGMGGKLVTGASLSRDGKWVALRTYSGLLEYQVPRRFSDWIKAQPSSITPPVEVQGEAVSYSRDGRLLVTTSEGSPCPVSFLKRK